MKFETTNTRTETMACQEMEARQEEKLTSLDRKPEAAEERHVPEENAEVIPVGEPREKRRRDRNQRKKKKRTQGNDGYQRRLAAARRGTSHRAEVARKMQTDKKMPRLVTVARRMRNIFRPNTTRRARVARCKENAIGKVRARDNVVRGTQKGWTPRWRQLMGQEGTKETRNRDFEDQLRLGSKMTSNGSYRKAIGLEISKRAAGTSTGLPKMKNCTLWRGRPPSKTEKKETSLWEEPVVEAQASLARRNEGRMNVKRECETTDQRTTGSCKCSGRAPLEKGADATGVTPHRRCQQNAWKRGRTVRLFEDEQPLEGSCVTYLHYAGHSLPRSDVTGDTAVTTQLWKALGSVP
jgi:hypothetical protein